MCSASAAKNYMLADANSGVVVPECMELMISETFRVDEVVAQNPGLRRSSFVDKKSWQPPWEVERYEKAFGHQHVDRADG